MKMILKPDMLTKTVYDIDYNKLKEEGIKLIIFDIDNTLKTYEQSKPTYGNLTLFNKLKAMGLNICLVSNGRKSRVHKYNSGIKLRAVYMGLKPCPFNLRRMMREFKVKSKETVIIGDQLFTDVIAGNLAKVTTILVEPIKPKKTMVEKIKRKLEKFVLKLYNVQ